MIKRVSFTDGELHASTMRSLAVLSANGANAISESHAGLDSLINVSCEPWHSCCPSSGWR